MYIYLIVFLMLGMCQSKLQKKASKETSATTEQTVDFSALKPVVQEIPNDKKTLGNVIKQYTVVFDNLSASFDYKIHWYETKKGDKKPSFINTSKTYIRTIGGANPGPNAIYGEKLITAIVEYPDGSKSEPIEVAKHKYLIQPGHDTRIKRNK